MSGNDNHSNGPGRFPVKNKEMEKKTVILRSGKEIVLSIVRQENGDIDVDTNIDIDEQEAEEIANMIL